MNPFAGYSKLLMFPNAQYNCILLQLLLCYEDRQNYELYIGQ